ncbi:MAG: hypothetical protein WEA04_01015 [Candidatus Andersenbacteria bacterium]
MSVEKDARLSQLKAKAHELREILSAVNIDNLLHGLPEREFREQKIIRAREIIHSHAVERVKRLDELMVSFIKATRKNRDTGTRGLLIEDMLNFITGMADDMELTEPGSFEDQWRHIRAEWKLALSVVLILFAVAFFIVGGYIYSFLIIFLLLLVVRLELLKKLLVAIGGSKVEALMGEEDQV